MSIPSAAHRLLSTPELALLISRRLHEADVSRFARTSRTLHLWLEPRGYAHIMTNLLLGIVMTLSKAIASLPVLAELRLSLKRDNDRTYHFPDALEAWSDLFFAYRSSSICVFDVKLLPIPYTQRRPVIVPGEHDGDGGSGGQNCEDALAILRRLNHLPRLKSQVSPQVEPGSKTENTKKIFEYCPNLQSLDICNLEPIDCRDDVARIFATCCPLLENVFFGGCTATTTGSVVPYELMSILEEQQVKWFN
ncbi:hypothetical protein K457DRAFT_14633 [Linnemannia elongata AG-77]|uniref:F-box domain-containing protein n=1 Tax=Linnemannia elongata AG-77 TaxID=1314771 RepID=A0A197K973_9FUNG|nr:hypothetical protein K457DRAFT_14633 [Linnemannia elongata AG-77]